MSKPKFIFFKMMGCGHCVHFYEKPSKETSPWAQLVRDQELAAKVEFVLMEWGAKRDKDGKVSNNPLPKEYSFVNYGPYFYLQPASDSTKGIELKGVARTHEAMKKWIMENLPKVEKVQVAAKPQIYPMSVSQQPKPLTEQKLVSKGGPMMLTKNPKTVPNHLLQKIGSYQANATQQSRSVHPPMQTMQPPSTKDVSSPQYNSSTKFRTTYLPNQTMQVKAHNSATSGKKYVTKKRK